MPLLTSSLRHQFPDACHVSLMIAFFDTPSGDISIGEEFDTAIKKVTVGKIASFCICWSNMEDGMARFGTGKSLP